jgi:hypothetical protein
MMQLHHFTTQVYAMAAGLFGTAVAIVIDALISVFHILGVSGNAADSFSRFLLSLGFIILSLAGSYIVSASHRLAALLLVLATCGFFLVLGRWAVFAAPLLLLAALLAFFGDSRLCLPGIGHWRPIRLPVVRPSRTRPADQITQEPGQSA